VKTDYRFRNHNYLLNLDKLTDKMDTNNSGEKDTSSSLTKTKAKKSLLLSFDKENKAKILKDLKK